MAEIVNLRLARKAKARGDAANAATANRVKFGTSTAERAKGAAEAERRNRILDDAKREN